jgi:hypothetical protein
MRRVGIGLSVVGLGLMALDSSHAVAGTCALCRQVLGSAQQKGLIQGFYWSIVLIAGMPLLIFATAGWIVLRHNVLRKRRRALTRS